MKLVVTGDIGLFIAFIAMVNSGFIVVDEATILALGKFTPVVIITIIGLVIIAALNKKGVRGAIICGILIFSLIGWVYALIIQKLQQL